MASAAQEIALIDKYLTALQNLGLLKFEDVFRYVRTTGFAFTDRLEVR